MAFGDVIDAAIAPFAPQWAARRLVARAGLHAAREFDAAARGRKTKGWRRPSTSADAEDARGQIVLRNGGRDLVRNNKYAAAGVRQMVANMVGDGISAQLSHPDKTIMARAQADWDTFAEGKVDGEGDFYEHQKLTARSIIVDGDCLTMWQPDDNGPNGRMIGLEADYLDLSKLGMMSDGGRVVSGVQYGKSGDRTAYWLFPSHPGDLLMQAGISEPVDAAIIDHVRERLRFGETRGASWLSSVAMTLRDIGDIEDAVRMQQKLQSCLGLILSPAEGQSGSPLTSQQGTDRGAAIETLRPGMIFRTQPGETVNTLNPTQSGGAVEFIRQQLAAVSANMVPYHIMTGDVSQANYSSLRAAMLGHWSLLDDWQQHVMIPHHSAPAVKRRMARMALTTGDKRFLQVKATWATPVRRFVDPVKDLMGELIEIRSGLKLLAKSLAERGINAEDHMRAIKAMNDQIDALGLALDSDPRRLTDAGVLQLATGFLAPKGDQAGKSAD